MVYRQSHIQKSDQITEIRTYAGRNGDVQEQDVRKILQRVTATLIPRGKFFRTDVELKRGLLGLPTTKIGGTRVPTPFGPGGQHHGVFGISGVETF